MLLAWANCVRRSKFKGCAKKGAVRGENERRRVEAKRRPSPSRKGENERVGERRNVENVRAKLRRERRLREKRSKRGVLNDFASTLRRTETNV